MHNPSLSSSTINAVMQHMDYVLLREEKGLLCYSNGSPETMVFLDVGKDGMISLAALEGSLQASGVNLDTFHAFLESL